MFANSVKLLSVRGFDIRIDPSWLVIAALITWSLAENVFPQDLPGLDRSRYLGMGLFAMLGFFGSLLLHELAHSVVARRLGVKVRRITLFLFGGVAELEAEPTTALDEFRIAIAGPLMSFLLAAVFWLLSMPFAQGGNSMAGTLLGYLATINLVVAVFNLVPAFPLDGGRVLRAFLWYRSGDMLRATRIAAQSGKVVAYTLMTLGVLFLFQGDVVSGLWQVMIGAFVLMAARASYDTQLAKTAFEGVTVAELMTRDPACVSPAMSLEAFVDRMILGEGLTFAPVVEDGVLLGHIDRAMVFSIERDRWPTTRVEDVFAGLGADALLSPADPVDAVFELVQSTGQRKFMVVEGRGLLGVLTLTDLMRHLHARDRLIQRGQGRPHRHT